MSTENDFLKKLELYLDLTFNDFDQKRILGYLQDYVNGLDPIVVYQNKIIEKIVIEVRKPSIIATQTDLENEALTLCNEYEISVDAFMNPPNGKSTNEVTTARKDFCSRILSKYKCTQNRLKEFFKVNHATISYYMVGKKIRKIKAPHTQKKSA